MRFIARNRSLLILALTAGLFSRAIFALFQDPEGPNLLVVAGLAAAIFLPSLLAYLSGILPLLKGLWRLGAAIVLQLLIAAGIYLGLR